jgi:hypothetical protein
VAIAEGAVRFPEVTSVIPCPAQRIFATCGRVSAEVWYCRTDRRFSKTASSVFAVPWSSVGSAMLWFTEMAGVPVTEPPVDVVSAVCGAPMAVTADPEKISATRIRPGPCKDHYQDYDEAVIDPVVHGVIVYPAVFKLREVGRTGFSNVSRTAQHQYQFCCIHKTVYNLSR